MSHGTLYVIGEENVPTGPVKIGMTFDSGGKIGRGGLNTGNWRELVVVHRSPIEPTRVRWREWLIHHRLRNRHVRGEWFRVRDLAGDDWPTFLDAVFAGTGGEIYPQPLGVPGHEIVDVRQPSAPHRHFLIDCSCGEQIDGCAGRSLPSALVTFATGHLALSRSHDLVRQLRIEPHHTGFTVS